MDWWLAASLGVVGGLARACFGLLRALSNREKIRGEYFLTSVVIAALLGGILGTFLDIDTRVAALAGYVGTDILENLIPAAVPKTITLKP
ncbi:hypothetical protein FJZ18_01780 [Candidatus Pacearchaeota archaeon]|nr:hypothetical protein [Candidatus Pacearchaeota archaeon]